MTVPEKLLYIDHGYVEGRGFHSSSQINPQWVAYLEGLLILAHNKMDEDNNRLNHGTYCRWCKGRWGYDGNGIHHEDDCVLVKIREVVHV